MQTNSEIRRKKVIEVKVMYSTSEQIVYFFYRWRLLFRAGVVWFVRRPVKFPQATNWLYSCCSIAAGNLVFSDCLQQWCKGHTSDSEKIDPYQYVVQVSHFRLALPAFSSEIPLLLRIDWRHWWHDWVDPVDSFRLFFGLSSFPFTSPSTLSLRFAGFGVDGRSFRLTLELMVNRSALKSFVHRWNDVHRLTNCDFQKKFFPLSFPATCLASLPSAWSGIKRMPHATCHSVCTWTTFGFPPKCLAFRRGKNFFE